MDDGRLHEEAVEHGAVVTVIVEAVEQSLIPLGLLGVRAPDDALVQIGDAQGVVLDVIGEQVLIQDLGQVVDRAGIGGIEDLLGGPLRLLLDGVLRAHLHIQVAHGDLHPGGALASIHRRGFRPECDSGSTG